MRDSSPSTHDSVPSKYDSSPSKVTSATSPPPRPGRRRSGRRRSSCRASPRRHARPCRSSACSSCRSTRRRLRCWAGLRCWAAARPARACRCLTPAQHLDRVDCDSSARCHYNRAIIYGESVWVVISFFLTPIRPTPAVRVEAEQADQGCREPAAGETAQRASLAPPCSLHT